MSERRFITASLRGAGTVLAAAAVLLALAAAGGRAAAAEATYVKLHPDFLVNLISDGRPRVLMATIEVMTRESGAIEKIRHHFPALRHELLLLLSEQRPAEIETVEGREALRKEALAAVNSVLERETGEALIEGLYFTNFIIE